MRDEHETLSANEVRGVSQWLSRDPESNDRHWEETRGALMRF